MGCFYPEGWTTSEVTSSVWGCVRTWWSCVLHMQRREFMWKCNKLLYYLLASLLFSVGRNGSSSATRKPVVAFRTTTNGGEFLLCSNGWWLLACGWINPKKSQPRNTGSSGLCALQGMWVIVRYFISRPVKISTGNTISRLYGVKSERVELCSLLGPRRSTIFLWIEFLWGQNFANGHQVLFCWVWCFETMHVIP